MTTTYKNVLLAIDLSPASIQVGQRAVEVATRYGAQISILHVVEYVPVEPMGETLLPSIGMENHLVTNARERVARLAGELEIPDAPQHIALGSTKAELVHFVTSHDIDLVVLGSHERHGLGALFNFTEDTILHAAPCDVLAVRLRRGATRSEPAT